MRTGWTGDANLTTPANGAPVKLSRLTIWLLAVVLLVGAATLVRADVAPFPRPQPPPPQPTPSPTPPPAPDPDDAEGVSPQAVVAATAASVGVTLLGVWVLRRLARPGRAAGEPVGSAV